MGDCRVLRTGLVLLVLLLGQLVHNVYTDHSSGLEQTQCDTGQYMIQSGYDTDWV